MIFSIISNILWFREIEEEKEEITQLETFLNMLTFHSLYLSLPEKKGLWIVCFCEPFTQNCLPLRFCDLLDFLLKFRGSWIFCLCFSHLFLKNTPYCSFLFLFMKSPINSGFLESLPNAAIFYREGNYKPNL